MAIKKEITDRHAGSNERGICWRTFSRNERGVLRIELSSGRTWLLPYGHWVHADLEKLEQGEQLNISFSSHDVRVEGDNMRELLLELQASNVELLREIEEPLRPLSRGVVIRSITVIDPSGFEEETETGSQVLPAGSERPAN